MNTELQRNQKLDASTKPIQPKLTGSTEVIATPDELAQKYKFIRKLGRGSQGNVYEAIDLADDKHVAIKQLRIDSVQTWKEYDLFNREAETLKNLHCSGVAKFYEALEFLDIQNPSAYIVQEYIEGRSLAQLMQSNYRFTTQRIFALAVKLLKLLKELHTHEPPIIHRDIKPSNILFRPRIDSDDFDVYLIDFGAVANPMLQSGGSTVAGTYGYMPPEQLMGKPTPASDIYALAATLVYMLSGTEPADMQIADFRLMIDPHLESVPQPVVVLLRQMLDPDKSARLSDHDLLIRAFENFANNQFSEQFASMTNKLSDAEINQRLFNVRSYNQAGNIDLWSLLPDQTPRPVPDAYLDYNSYYKENSDSKSVSLTDRSTNDTIKSDDLVLKDILQMSLLVRNNYLKRYQTELLVWRNLDSKRIIKKTFIVHLLNLFGMLVAFLVPIILLIALVPILLDNYIILGVTIFVFMTFLFFLFLGGTFKYCAIEFIENYMMPFIEYRKLKRLLNDIKRYQDNSMKLLFLKGRKSIATIVDVEKAPLTSDFIMSCPVYRLDVQETGYCDYYGNSVYRHNWKTGGGYYCFVGERWRIRYKFNPPDDASSADLVHEIVTTKDYTDSLHPGDLLPILYYIDPNDSASVTSMPYPIPYDELGGNNNHIGQSHQIK